MRKPKDYILLYTKGLCIGATEILHGVSGGTMSIVLNVYKELLDSLCAFNSRNLLLLRTGEFRSFWKEINGNFLLTIFSGIVTGLSSLLWIVSYLFERFNIATSAFFFSLFVLATLLVLRRIKPWEIKTIIGMLIGAGTGYLLTVISPMRTPDNPVLVFVSGMISVSSLLLPGISGAFILILIGKYQLIITSFKLYNPLIISLFLSGCIAGLALTSRFIQTMLAHYPRATVALLAGLMIGSLNKVWPWRKVLEYTVNSRGEQVPAFDKSILPWNYMAETGKDPQVFQALLMMALGVLVVVLIEKVAVRLNSKI